MSHHILHARLRRGFQIADSRFEMTGLDGTGEFEITNYSFEMAAGGRDDLKSQI